MRAFISSHDRLAGTIKDNDMESGPDGAEFGVDAGSSGNTNIEFDIGPNKLVSKIVSGSSKAIGLSGMIKSGRVTVGESSGFEALFLQTGDASYAGQMLVIGSGLFDDFGASRRNCIQTIGDFRKLKIHDIECANNTAGYYFVSAQGLSDYIAEIVDNRQQFSFGRLFGGARELNAWEKKSAEINSDRVVCGVKVLKRSGIPTSGSHRVGDRIERLAVTVDGSNMVLASWICTEAGTPGTWTPLRSSTVSPAT